MRSRLEFKRWNPIANGLSTRHLLWFCLAVLTLVAGLTFLPQVGNLGFYSDDWHSLWAGKLFGPTKIVDEYLTDRPAMGLATALPYLVFGANPLPWHLYAFILKLAGSFLACLLSWELLGRKRIPAFLAGLVVLVYPGYLMQPVALTYQNYLLAFVCVLTSLYLSLIAGRLSRKGVRRAAVLGACGTAMAGYLVLEWFIGMELVRLILLVMQTRFTPQPPGKQINRGMAAVVVSRSLPTWGTGLLFLLGRAFLFHGARRTTDLGKLFQGYLAQPLAMLQQDVIGLFRDGLNALFSTWSVPLDRLLNQSAPSDLWIGMLFAALGALVIYRTLRFLEARAVDPQASAFTPGWMITGGILCVFSAVLPLALTGRGIRFDSYNDKYTLPATLGVALVAAGVWQVLPRPRLRAGLAALLTFLSILTHQLNTADFREYWDYQKGLWWQLSWRAPEIADGTVLVPVLPGSNSFFDNYEIWSQANLVYGSREAPLRLGGEVANAETLPHLLVGDAYGRVFRRTPLQVDLSRMLLLSWPGSRSCLHVEDGSAQEASPFESPLARLVAPHSRVDLVQYDAATNHAPPEGIYGPEPERDWCYYYQKMSLARQQGDWETVVALADEAARLGFQPQDPSEWLPAYQGYAHLGRLHEANEIGGMLRSEYEFIAPYCSQYKAGSLHFTNSTEEYILTNLCPDLAQLPQ